MGQRLFADEARRCREWAAELAGRPEERMLLNIAREFEHLALDRAPEAGWSVPLRPRDRPAARR